MHLRKTLKLWRRRFYELRSFVPGLRRQHQMETMIGPLGYWKQLQRYQLQAVTALGLRPEHAMLDLGCGPLQGGLAFIRYLHPKNYVGVDLNPSALAIASEELSRQKLWAKEPRLLLSRSFGDDQLENAQFDFIWMSQILYYFDEPKLHELLAFVQRRLRQGGIMAGDILGPSTDRSFLDDPQPPIHTGPSLDRIARSYRLKVEELGNLSEFGYPRRLGLNHNTLLRISHW